MTRAILLMTVLVAGLFTSCAEKQERHLPREQMVKVMTDIYLAEVYSSVVSDTTGTSSNKNMDSLAKYYKTVLHHHGITLDEFSHSLRWYSDNPTELDSAYMNVLTQLSTMEGLANADAGQ